MQLLSGNVAVLDFGNKTEVQVKGFDDWDDMGFEWEAEVHDGAKIEGQRGTGHGGGVDSKFDGSGLSQVQLGAI